MATEVLLCIIKPDPKNAKPSEFDLYQIVSDHAAVVNIMIFEKEYPIKAFVEIGKEYTEECLEQLHMKKLSFGLLKVFKSKKTKITFKQTLQNIITNGFCKQIYNSDTEIMEAKQNNYDQVMCLPYNIKDLSNSYSGSQQQALKNNSSFYTQSSTNQGFQQNKDYMYDIQHFYQKQHSFYPINISIPPRNNYFLTNSMGMYNQPEQFNMRRVVWINNVSPKVNCLMLMNLFGCFGNILKIRLDTKRRYCHIEYELAYDAQLAVMFLHDQLFVGERLKVELSDYHGVKLEGFKAQETSQIKCMKGNEKYYRYKQKLGIKVNRPSPVLHFTSLSKKFNIFSLYFYIQKIKKPTMVIKQQKRGLNSDMFLAAFEDLSDSLEVLSKLHNKKEDGRLMKVSFSDPRSWNK